MAEKLERIYTVNLSKCYNYIRTKRARGAVKLLVAFLARHMKSDEESVKISNQVNQFLWQHGIEKPPRRIKVRAVKEGDAVTVTLVEEKEIKPKYKLIKRDGAKATAGAKPKEKAEKPSTKEKKETPAATKPSEAKMAAPTAATASKPPAAQPKQPAAKQ